MEEQTRFTYKKEAGGYASGVRDTLEHLGRTATVEVIPQVDGGHVVQVSELLMMKHDEDEEIWCLASEEERLGMMLDRLDRFGSSDPDEVRWLIEAFAELNAEVTEVDRVIHRRAMHNIIKGLMHFAWPGISRGPASEKWIQVMKEAQKVVGYVECHTCKGKGEAHQQRGFIQCEKCNPPEHGLCTTCYGTGLVNTEDA